MPSLQITITPNRRAAARFVGSVRRALQKAFVDEQRKKGLTQSDIARALKVHRSVINRELKGLKDMTLGRVGELAWAMGRRPRFSLDDISQNNLANYPSTAPGIQAAPLPTAGAINPLPAPLTNVYQMPPLAAAA